MVTLIIQELKERKERNTIENTRFKDHKKFSLLVKVWSYSLDVQSWYWHTSRSSDVVLPGD
jgi:hypothetical protein